MQKVNKIIAICSAGELYGGVEQWVVSFVDRVKGQGARGKEHFEQGQGARGKGQESLGSESFDQSVAGPMTHAPCPFDIIVVLFWDGELAHRLRQIGVEPIIIKTKGTYDLSVFKKIRQVLKEKNVAIVHTHGFKADVLCGIAAMQSGIPRVKTQHGAIEMKDALSVSSFKMRMNIVLSRFMEPFFQKIIFVTHDLMRKRWIKTKKMTVIHNGIGKPQAASGKSHDSVLGEGDTRQQGRPDPIPGRPDPIPGRPDPIPGRPGSIPGRPRESGDLGTEVPDKPSAFRDDVKRCGDDTTQQGHPDPIPGHPGSIPGRPGSIPGRPRESGDLGTEVPDKPSAFRDDVKRCGDDTTQQGRPDPIPGRPDPIPGRPGSIPGRPDPIPGRPDPIPGRPRESGDLGTEVPDKPSAFRDDVKRCGDDMSRDDVRVRKLDPKEAFKIGIVGRLARVKGHRYLIKALANLPEDCHAYFFGDGTSKADLLRYAHHCGVVERVHFMGFIKDIHAAMRGLDVFAMPSLHEGLPYTLLDAMYLRVPIVAAKVGGLKEVLINDKDALLFEPRDVAGLTYAIKHLYDEREAGRHMAKNAYDKVVGNYMISAMVAKYLGEYDKLVSCKP